MIEIDEAIIKKVIFHTIGGENDQSGLSNAEYRLEDTEQEEIFKRIFLKPFVSQVSTYEFRHEIDLELNPLFKLSQSIFNNEDFVQKSRDIHTHLKTASRHPNIKDGDLFIIQYDDIKIKDEVYEALGIYKIESKESYIETINTESGPYGLDFRKGIGPRKLDKACLIICSEVPYTLLIIDNGANETEYWKNDFISVGLKNDHMNNTNQILSMTKSFVVDQYPTEYETTKADQIDLLNRSVKYFKTHDSFDKKEFEKTVLQDEGVIASFRNFDKTFKEENAIDFGDNFEISKEVVKKQSKVFKSVLKLDKNFHVYIHGDRDMIEQGVDRDGRRYYKLYFEEET